MSASIPITTFQDMGLNDALIWSLMDKCGNWPAGARFMSKRANPFFKNRAQDFGAGAGFAVLSRPVEIWRARQNKTANPYVIEITI